METKYFNPEALENLLGSDENTILRMLQNIINNITPKKEILNTNYSSENWPLLKESAHFLKSNFRYLGCTSMADILKSIEINSLDVNKRTEIGKLIKEFNENFPLVIKEVEDYVNYLKK